MSVFGNMKSPHIFVERALTDTIALWFDTYAREFELQIGLASEIPAPRSYSRLNEFDEHTPEDQLPACLVISPGLAGRPTHDGEGNYLVPFEAHVAIVCGANDRQATHDLARYYATIIRTLLIQHRSLGGVANELYWTDESYDDDLPGDQRTLASSIVELVVWIPDVGNQYAGPAAPDTPPGTEWPEAETTHLGIDLRPVYGADE